MYGEISNVYTSGDTLKYKAEGADSYTSMNIYDFFKAYAASSYTGGE